MYQANVKKKRNTDRLQISKTIIPHKSVLYIFVDIFPRGKFCFVKLEIVSMAERTKR